MPEEIIEESFAVSMMLLWIRLKNLQARRVDEFLLTPLFRRACERHVEQQIPVHLG
jgi:hypothetical protein